MSPTPLAERRAAGSAWLAGCTDRPDLVRQIWAADQLAPIHSGRRWLAAESRLTIGWPAAGRIREEQRGPVLADPEEDRLWWLVPIDTAAELEDVHQLRVHPAGWVLHCPPADVRINGRFWLVDPDGTGQLNDAAVVAAAFKPGRYRLGATA